jgi:Fe-S cluster assembly iron-binding protein IscA
MKTPHLATALIAASAMAYTNDSSITFPQNKKETKFRIRSGGNQRQIRKDRRRLFAAGCKKAFSA